MEREPACRFLIGIQELTGGKQLGANSDQGVLSNKDFRHMRVGKAEFNAL